MRAARIVAPRVCEREREGWIDSPLCYVSLCGKLWPTVDIVVKNPVERWGRGLGGHLGIVMAPTERIWGAGASLRRPRVLAVVPFAVLPAR